MLGWWSSPCLRATTDGATNAVVAAKEAGENGKAVLFAFIQSGSAGAGASASLQVNEVALRKVTRQAPAATLAAQGKKNSMLKELQQRFRERQEDGSADRQRQVADMNIGSTASAGNGAGDDAGPCAGAGACRAQSPGGSCRTSERLH